MPDYLIDANILIYSVDAAEAEKRSRILALLRHLAGTGQAVLSAQSLSEFYTVSTRRIRRPLSPEAAAAFVVDWSRSLLVYPVTSTAVVEAVRGAQAHQMSYWDALIWAVAKLNGVQNILTEDVQSNGLVEGVRFVNPFAPGFQLSALG